jgi:hypothetical protein
LALCHDRPGQGLGDRGRIVPQRRPQLAQDLGLLRVTGLALDFPLEVGAGDGATGEAGDRGAQTQRLVDLRADLGLRHHGLEDRLGARVRRGPQAVGPEDPFDRRLVRLGRD